MRPGARVGFQGEPGAFSEEALLRLLPDALPVPHRTFRDVVRSVVAGKDAAGLLPVENTLAGGVAAAFDALQEAPVHAVREVVIPIRHFLMGVAGARVGDLTEVRSHPVALAQCERFFAAHPDVHPVAAHDTAGAAREVAQKGDRTVAAIAPFRAVERYGLEVLASDLQDRDDNQTRFLLVRPGPPPALGGPDGAEELKTSVIVETRNRPGALHDLLGVFAGRGLDLTFIESRPAGTPWTYRFILEFRHRGMEAARACLAEAASSEREVRVLGSYLPWGEAGPGPHRAEERGRPGGDT